MLSGSTISSDLGKYTVIIDDKNFMAPSKNSLGTWTTIWPDFSFRKMTFFDDSTYAIHWNFAIAFLIVEPAK